MHVQREWRETPLSRVAGWLGGALAVAMIVMLLVPH